MACACASVKNVPLTVNSIVSPFLNATFPLSDTEPIAFHTKFVQVGTIGSTPLRSYRLFVSLHAHTVPFVIPCAATDWLQSAATSPATDGIVIVITIGTSAVPLVTTVVSPVVTDVVRAVTSPVEFEIALPT